MYIYIYIYIYISRIHHGRQAYGNSEKSVPRVHFLKQNHVRENFSFFFADLGPDDEDDERKEKNYQLQHCLHRPDA
jgi:hypothetical protein